MHATTTIATTTIATTTIATTTIATTTIATTTIATTTIATTTIATTTIAKKMNILLPRGSFIRIITHTSFYCMIVKEKQNMEEHRSNENSIELGWCCHYNDINIVKHYVSLGTPIDSSHIASACYGDSTTRLISYLLENSDVNDVIEAVSRAVMDNNVEALRLLLETGKPIQDDKMKPLHQALLMGHVESARLLIKDGRAKILDLDNYGYTALYSALQFCVQPGEGDKKFNLISLLKENGYTIFFFCEDGKSFIAGDDKTMNDPLRIKQFICFLDNYYQYNYPRATFA